MIWGQTLPPAKLTAICDMLITAGADVDMPDNMGRTPLMKMLMGPEVPIVRQLLQANCADTVTLSLCREYFLDTYMAEAIAKNATDCATFIFGDSCSSTQDQRVFYDLSLRPEAMVNGKTVGLSKPPVCLFRLCRKAGCPRRS